MLRHSFFQILVFFLSLQVYVVQAQPGKERLRKADSLYQKQLFVESFDIYQELLQQEEVYSPAMLLKMAFIKESLDDYTGALYYLSLYYGKHPNRSTLKKMEALAQQHNLKGFEYSDYDFFATQARKYYMRILELLMMTAVVIVTIALVSRLRGKKLKPHSFGLYLAFIAVLSYYLNFLSFGRYGIVNEEKLAMMSGPSAGSALLRSLPKGNRLQLLGQEDVWYKVKLDDTVAYVLRDHILVATN